jgi:hypothetical protein
VTEPELFDRGGLFDEKRVIIAMILSQLAKHPLALLCALSFNFAPPARKAVLAGGARKKTVRRKGSKAVS